MNCKLWIVNCKQITVHYSVRIMRSELWILIHLPNAYVWIVFYMIYRLHVIYSNRETLWSNKQAFIQQTILYWINVVHKNMNSPNNCFVRYLFYYYFIMCLAVWAQQAFGDWMRPPSWAIGHTSINMSPGSDGLKVGQLWKNIAETKSFLWVVLALEKWLPKSGEHGDLWRNIMRGCNMESMT